MQSKKDFGMKTGSDRKKDTNLGRMVILIEYIQPTRTVDNK